MVLEHAIFPVKPGQAKEFSEAWTKARKIIEAAKGCLKAQMHQGVENPDNFILLVEWKTLEDHTEGFAKSEAIKHFGGLLAPFFAGKPAVDHYGHLSETRKSLSPKKKARFAPGLLHLNSAAS